MVKVKTKTELELLNEINSKLNTIIGICAIQNKSKEEAIKILASLHFSNSRISEVTGIPKGTVDVLRAKMNKR